MADRPPESGQGQDKARSKEGGGRGRRRRRKPDANGNKVEQQAAPKEGGGRDGNVREAGRDRQPGPGRGRQVGVEATRQGRPGVDPQRQGARNQKGGDRQRQGAPTARVDKPVPKPEKPEPPFKHVLRTYGLAIYETHQAAKIDREALVEKAKSVDQLNIVIRAEGPMDDPELISIGNVKVFAGTAWALIHDRRVADGWYNEPR